MFATIAVDRSLVNRVVAHAVAIARAVRRPLQFRDETSIAPIDFPRVRPRDTQKV
jgi:hypothetical protein